MADNSFPTVKENQLPEQSSMSGVKAIRTLTTDTPAHSTWTDKDDIRFNAEQIVGLPEIVAEIQQIADDAIVEIEAAASTFSDTYPDTEYYAHVVGNSGTIQDIAFMQRVFDLNKNLLAEGVVPLLAVPACGMVESAGKIARIFNMADSDNDLIEATNRWYAGGGIAPNEKKSIKGVSGISTAQLGYNAISFGTSDDWTVLLKVKPNALSVVNFIQLGSNFLHIETGQLSFDDGSVNYMVAPTPLSAGESHSIEFRYSNGNNAIIFDGKALPLSASNSAAAVFTALRSLNGYAFDGQISYFQLISRTLSAYESQQFHAFLSAEFPAIPTIAVGSQQVSTSNLEATVFGGTAIPEVQDDATWAALSTPAWSHYANIVANGVIYGKIYNGYAIPVINTYAPKGFHVPSELEITMLSDYLGGDTISGKKMKALFGGFDNAFSTNESGVSFVDGGNRAESGLFFEIGAKGSYWGSLGWLYGVSDSSIETGAVSLAGRPLFGFYLRLFSNTPNILTDSYKSGLFATDISLSPKSIRIPFNSPVKTIKIKSTTSLTNIEAKLFSYDGTELETLITGKACNATTKSFNVTVDQTMSYTDSYVRVTATGNGGVGMEIEVII